MNQPDTVRRALGHQDGETIFAEQWHAQVIAVVELLVAKEKIDPQEWSRTLGADLDRRQVDGAPDNDANYYDAFLTVLERTLEKGDLVARAEVDKRNADWREAYLSTPHGQPVALKN